MFRAPLILFGDVRCKKILRVSSVCRKTRKARTESLIWRRPADDRKVIMRWRDSTDARVLNAKRIRRQDWFWSVRRRLSEWAIFCALSLASER